MTSNEKQTINKDKAQKHERQGKGKKTQRQGKTTRMNNKDQPR